MREKMFFIMLKGLQIMITMITPELKSYIQKNISEWEEKAKATPNPIDDVIVGMVKSLFE